MTSYAPTFTPRYRARYVAAGIIHTIQIRGPRGELAPALMARGSSLGTCFSTAATVLAEDFAWISADIALTDSDVWYPADLPSAAVGTIALTSFAPRHKITPTTFSGRAAGSRARISMYGLFWVDDPHGAEGNNFIITPDENAIISAIATEASGHFRANSGMPATFYNRATIKPNDHLVKRVRQGIVR
jgi:hypothetical protein